MLYRTIVEKTPVDKGWSGDRKYHVHTADGNEYLLRLPPAAREAQFRRSYQRMQEAEKLGIPMCRPVELGECCDGVYALHSWICGEDATPLIPTLPQPKQYAYGVDAGRILKKLHTLPAPADAQPWAKRFGAKIDRKLSLYAQCPLKYENGEALVAFLADNRHLLHDRPQTYQHGDFHIGNMMIDRKGTLTIIDFDRDDHGDPWEEFNRIVWCAQCSPAFASGMVDGYFDGQVPMEFWRLLALYIASNTLGSLPWAIPYGDTEIAVMRRQAAQVLEWYNQMLDPVPSWYCPFEPMKG